MGTFFLRPDQLEGLDPWQALLPSFQSNELCRAFAETWFSRQQQTKALLESSPDDTALQAEASMLDAALEWMQSSSWQVED